MNQPTCPVQGEQFIRRRTQIAAIFPNPDTCFRLVGTVFVEIHEDWISRQENYLCMKDKFDNDDKNSKNKLIYRKKVASPGLAMTECRNPLFLAHSYTVFYTKQCV